MSNLNPLEELRAELDAAYERGENVIIARVNVEFWDELHNCLTDSTMAKLAGVRPGHQVHSLYGVGVRLGPAGCDRIKCISVKRTPRVGD